MEGFVSVNKYGLSRDIPDAVKREVRQRCRFGCIRCGSAIYRYHHFEPPFEEARVHAARGITLLCGTCHDLAHGFLSHEIIQKLDKNPKCSELGFSFGPFDVGDTAPVVVLGNMTFRSTPIILEAFGQPLVVIEPPEGLGTPFRLSAVLHDERGQEILRIVQNEWQGLSHNWDIEIEKSTITIRQALGRIALRIQSEPPRRLLIKRLDMFYNGLRIQGREGQPTTAFLPDGTVWFRTPVTGATIDGCARGIVIT